MSKLGVFWQWVSDHRYHSENIEVEKEMSNALSSTTVPIALRLPVDTYDNIKRKAEKQGILPSEWLKRRIIYDVNRPHGSR